MSAILNENNNIEHLKVPPHAIEAEQSVLGGLLMENDKFHDIQGIICEADFYRHDHRLIFRSMLKIMDTDGQFDVITLSRWLKDQDQDANSGGLAYLGTLQKDTPSAANIVNYAKIVAKKSQYRQLISIGSEISEDAFNEVSDTAEIIQTHGGQLDTVLDNQIGDTLDMNGIHRAAMNVIEENIEARKTKSTTGIPSGLPEIDKRLGGFQKKRVYLLAGRPGCLSGDTKIYVARSSKGSGRWYSLAELYRGFNGQLAKKGSHKWDLNIPTKIQSLVDDDLTGLNFVEDVIYSGVKKTFTVTTESGKEIRATKDHLFLTSDGFRTLGDLNIGDSLVCKAGKTIPKGRIKSKKYRKEICTKLPFSPYPTRIINGHEYHRVTEHRAVYDAALNELNLQEFIESLKTNKNHNFIFSQSNMHVHHLNNDATDNQSKNLILLSDADHTKVHASEEVMRKRFGQNEVDNEKIVSIEYFGKEDTYDICCADPYNNFIANDFVTHNSGKTAVANQFAIHASTNGFKVGILSLEMGTEELGLRMLAHFYQVSGTALLFGNEPEFIKLKSKIQSYKKNGRTVLADADLKLDTDTYSLAGITARMTQWKRKHGLDMVILDHVGLVENKGNNRNESVGEVSRTIKKMAKRLDIAILELVQLNRENVKNNRRPQESDLRDSGSLEQDADVIMFLHVDEDSKGEDVRPLWVGLSKVRYGIPGWIQKSGGAASFGFEGKTQTIREVNYEAPRF